jgi:hypothetical protein
MATPRKSATTRATELIEQAWRDSDCPDVGLKECLTFQFSKEIAALRMTNERLVAVLLQMRDALRREGWEGGPSLDEATDRIVEELFNNDADEGSGRAEDKRRVKALRQCNYQPWTVKNA